MRPSITREMGQRILSNAFHERRERLSFSSELSMLCAELEGAVMRYFDVKKDPVLLDIFMRLKRQFNPKKIYLFGSRASETARADSDYDVMVILESSEKSKLHRAQEAYEVLWGIETAVDVLVYTEDEFDDWKDELSSIAHSVATDGLELRVG